MGKECIYLGSPRDELGFRLWDLEKKKIVWRSVVFFEDQTIQDIKNFEKLSFKVVCDQSLNNSRRESPLLEPHTKEHDKTKQLQ